MSQLQDYVAFMGEYTDFFENMAEGEKSKLEALSSLNIEKMEQSIARQQATEKLVAQMEQRRMEYQESAGLGGKTLSQIVASLEEPLGKELEKLSQRLSGAIERIKQLNAESMELVRENLDYISQHAPTEVTGPHGYKPDKKRDESSVVSLFQKKI